MRKDCASHGDESLWCWMERWFTTEQTYDIDRVEMNSELSQIPCEGIRA